MLTMVMVLGMIPFSAIASEAQPASDLPTSMAGLSIAYPYNTETVQLTGTPADRFDALTFESARGEVESAQLILTPNFAVDSFELTMNSLKNENGNIIPSWAFEVYTQHYVTVSGSGNAANYSSSHDMYNPTYNTKGYDGTFPDALIPQDVAIAKGENKIAAGNNQGIWVNLNVQNAAPGTYTGSATLTVNGSDMQIPVSVHVYDVAITEEVHATNFIAIWWDMVQAAEGGIDRELADAYFDYLLTKRITPMEAWNVNRWDSSMVEAITGWAKDPRITSYLIQHQKGEDGIFDAAAMKTTLTTLINKQLEVGGDVDLFAKGYFYIYDEPRDDKEYAISNQITAQLDAIKAELAPMLAAYPSIQQSFLDLKQVVTAPNPTDKTYSKVGNFWNYFINDDYGSTVLTGDSYVYVPQYQWFQNADQRALYANEEEVWWYGCCHPISPYPTYHLNTPLVSARVESWMRYAYGIDGFLYSSVNIWGQYTDNGIEMFDFWNSYNKNGTPGDQILLYPGSAYGVEGPIGSIRTENIREGQEDYEYLWQLENVYGADISAYTANLYSGVIPDTDASIHYNNRKALLTKLEQLNVAANGATNIAPGQEGFVRGVALTPGVNQQIDVNATTEFDLLSFEYKVTGGNKIDLALLPDWSNYFGYYQFGANGAMAAYPGIDVITLDDGYYRVIFDMDELTYKAGEPSTLIDFFFLRNTSDAEGYVDNVQVGMHGDPEFDIPETEPPVTEPTVPETEAPTEPPVVEKPTIFDGGAFTAANDLTINLDNDQSVTKVSFDYKIVGSGHMQIALLPDWSAYFGYFKLDTNGEVGDYAGVTTENLGDGYIRVFVDMAAVTQKTGTPSDVIKMLFIRGAWTTADGEIRNIRINESACEPSRGTAVTAGVNHSIDVDATEEIAILNFDYKIVGSGHMQIALLPNWSAYFGYFKLDANGEVGDYVGVTTEKLEDGYIRVAMNLNDVTAMAGTPSKIIDFMYIRGDWSTANGYIDNVQYTLQKDMPRGQAFEPGTQTQIMINATEEVSQISFDYKITNDGDFDLALLPDWSSYFGYFGFLKDCAEGEYAGVTTEKLEDGYVHVTIEMDKLIQMAGTPSKVISFLYLRTDWGNGAGYIDNVQYTLKKDMPRGQAFEPGTQTQIMINATEEVSQISFDYKITNDGDFDLALLPDWSSYFGYFGFLKDCAEGEYAGVTTEKLEDGYVHVTIEMDKLIQMAGTPSKVISFLYLRTDWGNGAGYIDNVQFTTHTHKYEAVVTDPTCLDAGFTTHTCSCGDSYVDTQVDALGHNYESVVTAPTPSAQGFTTHTCSRCGDSYVDSYTNYEAEGYIVLSEDMVVNMTLNQDLYIDLNGHTMSGTINTNGFKVYGMDAATNGYTCETLGYFSCVDAEGNAIIPENHVKTDLSGDVMRYMTIATENGYTFHRFYVGITKRSLAPAVTGVGYKAEFYADEMVQAQVSNIGYNLWLEGGKTISREAAFKNTLTLRVKNFDAENYGETNLYATVWMTIGEETITSSDYSLTLRQVVEAVNADVSAYSETQLQACRDMIAANPIMESWQVENILKQEVIRGEAFTAATNKTIALDNTEVLESISFEYKITDGSHFQIALLPDWNNFYGYFKMMADGPEGAYDGMTWETLEDGYIRVNFDISALTRMTGTPAATISMLFINGSYSTANGYIDNVQYTVKEPVYIEQVFAGADFAAGISQNISFTAGNYDIVTFDYKWESGTKLWLALSENTSVTKFYGLYKFDGNGEAEDYQGITSEKLDNGSVRITLNIAELNRTNNGWNTDNAPATVSNIFIRGDWSDANGTIENIRGLTLCEEESFNGADFVAGVSQNISFKAGDYDIVTFDYKWESGTKLWLALSENTSVTKFYGLYKFDGNGEAEDYQGITSEKLDNGSVRITLNLAELNRTNNGWNTDNAPATVSNFFIRGDWSDAAGEITNIRCLSLIK